MKKPYLVAFVCVLAVVGLAGCTTEQSSTNQSGGAKMDDTSTSASKLSSPGKLPDDQIQNKKAVISTPKGTIEITLWADKAPLTVSNFVYLANQGFYDGLTFHRVEEGFVVQGGDPDGNGTGDPGYKFDDEKVQGEYVEGTVAMANSGPNTNGSQFFINLEDNSSKLTKAYNLFGQVTSGMDVVKQLVKGDKMTSVKVVSAQ
jgi:cyclophilin family peptidyl-prolyl cis-trans isomerase/outer membrane murein-binding lipoprotein Lpp